MEDDTIFALSSGTLPSGIAVIRLSGSRVRDILKSFIRNIPKPRFMHLCKIHRGDGSLLDRALVVYFPAPQSFTGEECGEFHLHGGKAVVTYFLAELGKFTGCRLAEAGEFARRAFINGKLDLTTAEGLADLILAETESQYRLAMIGAGGDLAKLYRSWRNILVKIRAAIEAELNFSEEDDIPKSYIESVWKEAEHLILDLHQHIDAGKRARFLREGIKIVLAGAPNVGKSSIMNRLAGRSVSLVTDIAGTTRDALEVNLTLGFLPVLFVDTAGLHETEEILEKMGIAVAMDHIKGADLVLLIEDMSSPEEILLPNVEIPVWRVGNKCDLVSEISSQWSIQISTKTEEGWENFLKLLQTFCREKTERIGNLVPIRERHCILLQKTVIELEKAFIPSIPLEFLAEHLRRAANFLGHITGDIALEEDILDVVFSEFCIGK